MSETAAAPVTDTGDARVRAFLADSLALWRVAGAVEAGHPPVVAVITAQSGATISIERPAGEEMPFRWLVRSRGTDPAAGSERTRPCTSLVGLLNAIRGVLGVDRGSALRVTPAPEELRPSRSGSAPGWEQK